MDEHAPLNGAVDISRCLLPTLSPEEVHKNILRCHALKNRVHRKLLEWLHVLIENGYSRRLGSVSPVQYVMEHLRYEKTEAYHVVEVATALPNLPRCLKAFERARLSWSQLKRIASVSKPGTEEAWLSFALAHKPGDLKAEARDALRNGRDLPRKNRRGLPNTIHDLRLPFTLEEHEIIRKAMEKRAARMKSSKGDETWRPSPVEVFLEFCLDELATADDLPSGTGRRSIFDVVYGSCTECKASHIKTANGPVEVPYEHVAAIEGQARKLTFRLEEEFVKGEAIFPGAGEGDIPADVEVKVLARHDHACARCGRRLDLHLHHIVFRSRGGPHEVWNLLVVCRGCHSSLHDGSLEVFLDSLGEVHWRSKADRITHLMKEEIEELASIPSMKLLVEEPKEEEAQASSAAPVPLPASSPTPLLPPQPPAPLTPPPVPARVSPEEAEGVAGALQKLGYRATEARRRVERALVLLRGLGRAPTGNEVLSAALRGKLLGLQLREDSASAENSGGEGPAGGSPRGAEDNGGAAGNGAGAVG